MPEMDADKAIEILSEAAYGGSLTFDEDFKTALKIGIKALLLLTRDEAHHLDSLSQQLLLTPDFEWQRSKPNKSEE